MNSSLRLGVIVGTEDPWRFFHSVYKDWQAHFQVDVFQMPRWRSPIFYFRVKRFLSERALAEFMRRHDVVFFEWASELLALATRLPKTCRIIVRVHRYEMFQWVAKINWDVVDQIIFVSRAMQDKFYARVPDYHGKTAVIPVGISIETYRLAPARESRGTIGTLCNLAPRKRVYELILAFYGMSQKKSDLHLHIGGGSALEDADYYDALQRLVDKVNLREHVTFHGEIVKPWEWYPNIDVFVSNSYSEGMQVALMEAMASGCYCLAHHWDGVEELLPAEYLYYTETELQDKVLQYFELTTAEQRRHQEHLRQIVCDQVDEKNIHAQIRQLIG
jgi:glycosyltransferase involved in cell wall biosynthesis